MARRARPTRRWTTSPVSKGTVYLYFKGKDDLLVALSHRPLDEVLERFAELQREDGVDGMTLLDRMLRTHRELVRAHRTPFRLATGRLCSDASLDASVPSAARYRERGKMLQDSYHAAIERGIRDGSIRSDLDPNLVGGALWAGMFGAMFLQLNAPYYRAHLNVDRPIDFDAVAPTLQSLLLTSLAPTASTDDPDPTGDSE